MLTLLAVSPLAGRAQSPAAARPASTGQGRPRALHRADHQDDDKDEAHGRAAFRQSQSGDSDDHLRNADRLQDAIELTTTELRASGGGKVEMVAGLKIRSQGAFDPRVLTAPSQWCWRGPRNVGGRTRSLAIDPDDPDRIWAGSVAGGLWVNRRNAKQAWEGWKIADASLACYTVSAIVIAPKSKAIFVGTGEYIGDRIGVLNANRESGLRGSGIFRGEGQNRERMKWKEITDNKCDDFDFVNRLAVAEDEHQTVLLAATSKGLFRTTMVPNQTGQWERVWSLPGGFADVEFHPSDGTRAVAASFTSVQRKDGQALYSTDAGKSWTKATHTGWLWKGRIDLAYARAKPDLVYASAAASESQDKPFLGRIFRSTDGGRSYKAMATALCPADKPDCGQGNDYLFGNGDYCNAIWAGDPCESSFLLVGGPELRCSRDGGNRLQNVAAGGLDLLVENFGDHHAIVETPAYQKGDAASVFVVNDGGVYMTSDVKNLGGAAASGPFWKPFNSGYGTVQFYSACGGAASNVIIGGAQDNDVLFSNTTVDAKSRWHRVPLGDGGVCVADPSDPTARRFYISSDTLGLKRLELIEDTRVAGKLVPKGEPTDITGRFTDRDGTEKWKEPGFRIEDLVPVSGTGVNFIAPFVLDPNSSDRLLAGGVRLWRTPNPREVDDPKNSMRSGPRWQLIKEPFPNDNTGPSPISTIAVAKGNSDIIWVGHNNGRMFRTRNGTAERPTWEPMVSPIKGNRYCTRIVIHPSRPSRVYALFGGYHDDNLWFKDDNQPWKCLKVHSPAAKPGASMGAPLRSLAIHPDFPKFLYLGSDVGLRVSDDCGVTWWPVGEGPIFCPVDELCWVDRTLIAATHGRGIYSVDLKLSGNGQPGAGQTGPAVRAR
jgi:hypothetical protein